MGNYTKQVTLCGFKLRLSNDKIRVSDLLRKAHLNGNNLSRSSGSIRVYGSHLYNDPIYVGAFEYVQMLGIPNKSDLNTRKEAVLSMDDSEGLQYLTCFLYDSEIDILMVESRFKAVGVSVAQVCDYLETNFNTGTISTEIVIEPGIMRKFNKLQTISKVDVKIANHNGSVFKSDKASIRQITNAADRAGAHVLEYAIRAQRKQTLSVDYVKGLVRDLLKFKKSDEVEKIIVTGKEDDIRATSILNLIERHYKIRTEEERARFSPLGTALHKKFKDILGEYQKQRNALIDTYGDDEE